MAIPNTMVSLTATHCNTLQHTATHCNTLRHAAGLAVARALGDGDAKNYGVTVDPVCCSVLQCVAVCCSVLQCVAVCYSRLLAMMMPKPAESLLTQFVAV